MCVRVCVCMPWCLATVGWPCVDRRRAESTLLCFPSIQGNFYRCKVKDMLCDAYSKLNSVPIFTDIKGQQERKKKMNSFGGR